MRPSLLTACLSGWVALLLSGCIQRPLAPQTMEPVARPTTWGELESLPPANPPTETVRYGEAPQQIIDVRVPADRRRNRPIAILIHGGCWLNRFDRHHFAHLAEALRQRGWVTANLEYRRLGDAGGDWPGPIEDVQSAFRHLIRHAGNWGGDARRIVIAGHSAGGHLALLLAGREPAVRGVIGIAAIADLAAYREEAHSCAAAARKLMPDESVAAANPILQPPRASTRVILWSGSEDKIVPPQYGERYASKFPGTLHVVWPGAGHFDLVSPRAVLWPQLLEQFDTLR